MRRRRATDRSTTSRPPRSRRRSRRSSPARCSWPGVGSAMRAAGNGGDILFVASLAAATPWPFHLPYAAANAGVEQAARTLRLELEGTGIRITTLRCGETVGTDFATREMDNGRAFDANEQWFRMNLLRHTGLMVPSDVADAVVAAITLPRGHQYGFLEVTPTAPIGPLPTTFEEWGAAMVAQF